VDAIRTLSYDEAEHVHCNDVKVGFIGLGQMGREMAARLIDAGHALTVWNRTASACEALRRRGAAVASAPAGVLERAEVVVSMLADDAATCAVWLDGGLAGRMGDAAHLEMATLGLNLVREMKSRGPYVAAPVFGRPQAAARGELDAIVAGPGAALERCRPLLAAMARQVFVVGEAPEQANAVKIARNFLLSTVIEGLGEAMALARGTGVPPQVFLDIITGTSLNAPAYKNYGKLMVEGRYDPAQFTMTLGLKDVELALATAREAGVPLPSAELVRRHLLAAIDKGDGAKDWAAVSAYSKT
jgi:3-hydroxyisobutyrate dehydrogenase-like beta-hydroxyacid dehydrogenase